MDYISERICAMNIHYRFYPIEYFFSEISKNGFKNAEIWLCPQHFEITYRGYEDSSKLKNLANKYGIKLACLCAEQNNPKPSNMAARDERIIEHSINYFKNLINLASELEVPKILLTSGWAYFDEPVEKAFKRSVSHMQELADYAKQKDVTICVEPLQKFETRLVNNIDSMEKYLNEVDRENVKIALDTGALGGANESIKIWFDRFKDRIVHCHYVDGTPTGHLPIGKGDRNIKEDLETFLANDYRGLYSFEFANGSCFANPSQIDIDAINVMKNSINQIRKEEV